jgi:uncharacterized coiled-coil DUF342 family protein
MSTQTTQTEPTQAAAATPSSPQAADKRPAQRAISDPREVATVVMARMNQVNAKKDELAAAINGLVDITQQLTRTYGEQLLAIEQLRRRVKALEAAAPSTPPDPSATVQ